MVSAHHRLSESGPKTSVCGRTRSSLGDGRHGPLGDDRGRYEISGEEGSWLQGRAENARRCAGSTASDSALVWTDVDFLGTENAHNPYVLDVRGGMRQDGGAAVGRNAP